MATGVEDTHYEDNVAFMDKYEAMGLRFERTIDHGRIIGSTATAMSKSSWTGWTSGRLFSGMRNRIRRVTVWNCLNCSQGGEYGRDVFKTGNAG